MEQATIKDVSNLLELYDLRTIFTVSLSMIFIVFDRFFAGIFTSNPKIVELATIRMTYILILKF